MPGLERRLARYPQLFSRVGFAHEYRPLRGQELGQVLELHCELLGIDGAQEDPDARREALAAAALITGGNFRLIGRLFSQVARILEINGLSALTREVVETARPLARDRAGLGGGPPPSAKPFPSATTASPMTRRSSRSWNARASPSSPHRLIDGQLTYALAEMATIPHAAVVVEDRYSNLFKLEHAHPGFVAEMLAALTVRYPTVPIAFRETRPLADEWTYRVLGAALALQQAETTAAVSTVIELRASLPHGAT